MGKGLPRTVLERWWRRRHRLVTKPASTTPTLTTMTRFNDIGPQEGEGGLNRQRPGVPIRGVERVGIAFSLEQKSFRRGEVLFKQRGSLGHLKRDNIGISI